MGNLPLLLAAFLAEGGAQASHHGLHALPLPLAAFFAGVISFLSPCVLPLVPGYVSLISGSSIEELRAGGEKRGLLSPAIINSLFFIAGFTIVFVLLGAAATGIGHLARSYQLILMRVAGVIIIIFGLHLTGLVKIKFLYTDARMHQVGSGNSVWGAFLIGFAFAFGWTPCIGPILATILAFASTQGTVGKGVMLLTIYSMGLGVPFLLTSLGIDRFLAFYGRFRKYLHAVEVLSGIVLIILGALILTRYFTLLSAFFSRHLGFLSEFM
jgi:cytochrome c-type biogenesis protein